MSRFIDADLMREKAYQMNFDRRINERELFLFNRALSEMPTVHAVPVVASDRNKLCPINHGLRCKDIDNCAFWCEWGQCAVKAIAVAYADGERNEDAEKMHPVECDAKDCKYNAFGYCAKEKVEEAIKNL